MGFPNFATGRKPFSGKSKARRKRRIPGTMNKAETAFAEYLVTREDVKKWAFDRVTYTLAERCDFTPDFYVLVEKDGALQTVHYEVKAQWSCKLKRKSGIVKARKAHWEDDARVKMKMAAELFDEHLWIGVSRNQDGTWAEELFGVKE